MSEIPGTTRDTVEELMEIGGIPIHLVDTAGMRDGGDHVERLGVERSVKAMEQADLVLAVFDLTGSREGAERELLRGADAARWVIVGNKRDLVEDEAEALARLSAYLEEGTPVAPGGQPGEALGRLRACSVSALTGEGVDELRETIQDIITGGGGLHLEEPILAGERQRALVDQALGSTAAAMNRAARGEDEELVCEDIRMAAEALGRITGEDLTPDLLEEIFSRFCLGK